VHDDGREGPAGQLVAFRQEIYGCLALRADALFELTDAVLCTDGPLRSLVGSGCRWRRSTGAGTVPSTTR
jgi:hypothetical protein